LEPKPALGGGGENRVSNAIVKRRGIEGDESKLFFIYFPDAISISMFPLLCFS
jgi:hypothetical protein